MKLNRLFMIANLCRFYCEAHNALSRVCLAVLQNLNAKILSKSFVHWWQIPNAE